MIAVDSEVEMMLEVEKMIWLIQIQMKMMMRVKIVFLIVSLFLIWSIFSESIFSELIVLVSTSLEIVLIRIVILLVRSSSWDFDQNSFQWDSLWRWTWIFLASCIFVSLLSFIEWNFLSEVFDTEILQWWSSYLLKLIRLVFVTCLLIVFNSWLRRLFRNHFLFISRTHLEIVFISLYLWNLLSFIH